jgi:hypothetical protein
MPNSPKEIRRETERTEALGLEPDFPTSLLASQPVGSPGDVDP